MHTDIHTNTPTHVSEGGCITSPAENHGSSSKLNPSHKPTADKPQTQITPASSRTSPFLLPYCLFILGSAMTGPMLTTQFTFPLPPHTCGPPILSAIFPGVPSLLLRSFCSLCLRCLLAVAIHDLLINQACLSFPVALPCPMPP